MSNIRELTIEYPQGNFETHIVIDREDGSKLSMLKSTYEAQQAEQSTPIVINEASTK
jgi:hypothetical protein